MASTGVGAWRERFGQYSRGLIAAVAVTVALTGSAAAQESLCDNSYEDCRARIIALIRAETVGIDVSFWFMTDTRYASELITKHQSGVPVRILLDLRGDENYPSNANTRQWFVNAGIPIRHKFTTGINHWKMMLYAGQQKVHFSAANFANGSYSPTQPYTNYVDEAIYFTDDPAIVGSFMTKYDDNWTNTADYQNFANISGPLLRRHPTSPISPDLNFLPDQDFIRRVVTEVRQETVGIDAVIFRITQGDIPLELISKHQAGVPVRLITDQAQYRNTTYYWHSYNIDRMYVAGIPLKWKDDSSGQDMHQKSLVLHGRQKAIFGSSNWTSSSGTTREHNYFSPSALDRPDKWWMVQWFLDQFDRKWNNHRAPEHASTAIDPPMYHDFVPGWPEQPVIVSPANQALGVATTASLLRWEGGWWAHKYDLYFGTTNPPPLVVQDFMPGSNTAGVRSTKESYNPCAPPPPLVSACPGGLAPGVTYYWRIRSKTMVGNARAVMGPVWTFTTGGDVPPPPAPINLRATGATSTGISIAWDDVAGEQGYKVERKLASASSTTWTQIATTAANVAAYDNATGLVPNTAYQYRVRAYTTGGNSAYSNIITVSTLATSPDSARILADTYVRGGPAAATNYGTAMELIAKFSADPQYNRIAYMKLDIGAVQPGNTVVLRLAGRLSDTRAATVTSGIYASANITWAENTITWNNRPLPDLTTMLGTVTVGGTATQWYDVDLTAFVQAQRSANQTTVTIVFQNSADTLPYVSFGSRESNTAPLLVITP